jgi:hypothetical protein
MLSSIIKLLIVMYIVRFIVRLFDGQAQSSNSDNGTPKQQAYTPQQPPSQSSSADYIDYEEVK